MRILLILSLALFSQSVLADDVLPKNPPLRPAYHHQEYKDRCQQNGEKFTNCKLIRHNVNGHFGDWQVVGPDMKEHPYKP